jgi:hypothetical protein
MSPTGLSVYRNFIGILLFLLLRSPCKNVKPYNNPFGGNKNKREKKKEKIPKIVSTFVYASNSFMARKLMSNCSLDLLRLLWA